jgi:hypothetical protein
MSLQWSNAAQAVARGINIAQVSHAIQVSGEYEDFLKETGPCRQQNHTC